MSEKRDMAMIAALETVMGEMGDMHIPISSLWLERLIRRAGVNWEIYDDEVREVDSSALSALCALARRNFTYRLHNDVAPVVKPKPDREAPGSYQVFHSNPPHVADGMIAIVSMGEGALMEIPNPQAGHHGSIGWTMTYGNAQAVRLAARGLIESFDYLLSGSLSMKEATHRLRLLRNARRELANGRQAA